MASLKGPDGRYAYVNTGFSQRVGRDASAIVGSTVHDLFAPDLARSYARQDQSVLETGRPLVSHLELIVRADRTLGWYVTGKTVVEDEDGQRLGVAALSIDLNSQVQSGHAGLARAIAAYPSECSSSRRRWMYRATACAGWGSLVMKRTPKWRVPVSSSSSTSFM